MVRHFAINMSVFHVLVMPRLKSVTSTGPSLRMRAASFIRRGFSGRPIKRRSVIDEDIIRAAVRTLQPPPDSLHPAKTNGDPRRIFFFFEILHLFFLSSCSWLFAESLSLLLSLCRVCLHPSVYIFASVSISGFLIFCVLHPSSTLVFLIVFFVLFDTLCV